jgi:hypothetical protein
MTPAREQFTVGQDNDREAKLRAMLKEGQEAIRRVSQHVCLLERRLRGGGNPGDLVVLVQDIKFAIADLQTLLQSAERKITKCG